MVESVALRDAGFGENALVVGRGGGSAWLELIASGEAQREMARAGGDPRITFHGPYRREALPDLSALTVVLSLAAVFLVPVMVFQTMALGMIISVIAVAIAS